MAFRDYEEFIAALNGHGVRYLIVGAHAVAFHARPRATRDLDTTFSAAWKNRVEARFGAVPAYYLGLDDLIRAKEAAGRAQDRADARVLRQAKGRGQRTKRSSRRRSPHRG